MAGVRAVMGTVLGLVVVAAACGGDGAPPPNRPLPGGPFADYVPDPEIFVAAVDFDDDDQAVDYSTQRIARHQVVLVMADDAAEAELSGALESLQATIVGQIPEHGLYQLSVDASTVAELEQVQQTAAALPGVEHATFNHTMTPDQGTPDYCHANDDLHGLDGADRCVPRDTGYFQMVPIVEELKKHTSLSDVRVAVIDTGVESDVDELKLVGKLNLNHPGFPTHDVNGHGTRVAGVIAATNGDGGVNGIAYRVLGHKLTLLVGRYGGNVEAAAMVKRAINAEADVVNMSFGSHFTAPQLFMAAADNAIFWDLFDDRPETLFVMSAGNDNLLTSPLDRSPIGNGINTLVVGGSAACDAETRWYEPPEEGALFSTTGSNHGPMVDIAAPGQRVPLVRYDPEDDITAKNSHALLFQDGTSFAAPQVAALGAILKSFDRSLSGEQTRSYILNHAYTGSAELGSRRLILPLAIEQLMIDRDPSEAVKKLVDADEQEGRWDLPGIVVNRICGGAEFTISEKGTFRFAPSDEFGGAFNPLVLALIFVDDPDAPPDEQTTITFGIQQEFLLQLYQEFNIPTPVTLSYAAPGAVVGNGTTGYINFTECAITDRFNDAIPATIELGGVVEGGLDIITPPLITPTNHTIEGTFHLPVILNTLTEAQYDALESQCVGGIERE